MASPMSLPMDEFLPEALNLVQKHGNLVITAAPGAGKTTRLPAYLAKHAQGKVLVLEPRRMAAMAAALRVAEEQNWELSREVGYLIRFANKTSAHTKLIFLTEALLARKMTQDPELQGVEYVILDEFHERSLHVDLALGLLRELQQLGSSLKLVVMSATLDAEKISAYLGQAPVLSVPGKLFPLDVRYQKKSQLLQTSPAFFSNFTENVQLAFRETDKDILAFLPGLGEIDRAYQALSLWVEKQNAALVPLHGSLPLEAQRQALQKGSRRKIILATNIAESSVTVDGVSCVVDSGLAKSMKHNLKTGFSRLELGRISQASAQQRAGRAARQFPGVCYRLWNKLDETSMPAHEPAEILRAELSESLLFLSAQGVSDFENFSWYEKPASPVIKKATETLQSLGALDKDARITELGRHLLRWPLPPRLAKLMVVAETLQASPMAADIAALLQERDFMSRQQAEQFLAENYEDDLRLRWEILSRFRDKRETSHFHSNALQTILQSARQILAAAKPTAGPGKADAATLKSLLLQIYPDRLCRRRQAGSDRAVMVGGRGVRLSNESVVKNSEFFLALDGVETSQDRDTQVGLATGLSKEFLMTELGHEMQKKGVLSFHRERQQFYVREVKTWKGLELEEGAVTVATAAQVAADLPRVLTQEWELVLKENERLANWLERLQFLIRHQDLIPKVSLQDHLKKLGSQEPFSEEQRLKAFTMAASGEKDFQTVLQKDLVYFFETLLSAEIVEALHNEVPERLQAPSGNYFQLRYSTEKPFMEVRIQEVFGWLETPRLLYGKVPLTLHLLGPNYRPMQVTSNLQSFWNTGYAEVRKELRARYPKHSWPEDPLTAKAVAKGRSTK